MDIIAIMPAPKGDGRGSGVFERLPYTPEAEAA
jgi:hypothetical protein